MYHVMSRGDRGEKIFLDDVDRQDFLKTLAEACQTTLSIKAIAARVHLGTSKGANTNLHRWMRGRQPQDPAQPLLGI